MWSLGSEMVPCNFTFIFRLVNNYCYPYDVSAIYSQGDKIVQHCVDSVGKIILSSFSLSLSYKYDFEFVEDESLFVSGCFCFVAAKLDCFSGFFMFCLGAVMIFLGRIV